MTSPTGTVTVAAYDAEEPAEAARAVLEEAGIAVILAGYALEVPRADAARALEILRAREAAAREAAAEEALLGEDEADVACIACGARIPEYLERCPACGFSYG